MISFFMCGSIFAPPVPPAAPEQTGGRDPGGYGTESGEGGRGKGHRKIEPHIIGSYLVVKMMV